MRILSLLASGTEIVCALGAGDWLVGRSHECDNPAWVRSLPCCSDPAFDVTVSSAAIDAEVRRRIRSGEPLYLVHHELIQSLQPDLLITQQHCQVCAVTPANVGKTAIRQIALQAGNLNGIFQDIVDIAKAMGRESQGLTLVRREQQRLAHVSFRTTALRRPSLVVIEWIDPLFAMGNWGPELVEIANGDLLLSAKGEYSKVISAEDLQAADPEFIIVAPCGFGLERALKERSVLEALPGWPQLRAVQQGKVVFADGNLFFNRSGMTISRTAEIIAEILHGITFEPQNTGQWTPIASWQRVH